MATIKLYTDLEQSKKLAEILPNKSADMAWYPSYAKNGYSIRMLNDSYPLDIIGGEHDEIPAWSLAALLNILPVSCDDGQHCLALINPNPNEKTEWLCAYEDDNGNLMMECYADSQIDACVAMIVKLNKLKLL